MCTRFRGKKNNFRVCGYPDIVVNLYSRVRVCTRTKLLFLCVCNYVYIYIFTGGNVYTVFVIILKALLGFNPSCLILKIYIDD